MAGKQLAQMTFEELVDFCAEKVLESVMQGKFREGIFVAVDLATRWSQEQEREHQKEG